MNDSVASRYADAVARIQARRRMRVSGLPVATIEASGNILESQKSNFVDRNAKIGPSVPSNKFVPRKVFVSTAKEACSQDSLEKFPVVFPPSSHFNLVDVQLMKTIEEHQKLISTLTTGADMLLIVSSVEETVELEIARRTSVYCTPNLQKLAWKTLEGPDAGKVSYVNIEDMATIVCIFAKDVENKFLPDSAPILRVMIRGEHQCYDFVCSDETIRQIWVRGLSLAYGLQTCPVTKLTDGAVMGQGESEKKKDNLFQ